MPGTDGKGLSSPKSVTPQDSVEGTPHTSVPGGESKSKTWIKTEGPNPEK